MKRHIVPLISTLLIASVCLAEQMIPASPSFANCLQQRTCPHLQSQYEKATKEGERNFVLNHTQAGLMAFQLKEYELATQSFDQALLRIESVFSNNERATKARSLWYEEGAKDFKGEPYERAMAYYYRGLLYLLRGDYENARAAYKNGVLQDAFAEEEQYRCDFALLIFLEGWASQCLGDFQTANAAYEEVRKLRPDFVPPKPDDNTLLIVETGKSPRKVADGIGHDELKYRRGRNFTEKRVQILISDQVYPLYPMEDIFWQAATRGGRHVDKILKGKAHFMETQRVSGDILSNVATAGTIASSAPVGDASALQGVSAALGLISVVQLAIALNVNPRADTRYWNNLPDTIHIITLKTNPASLKSPIKAEFLDAERKVIPSLGTEFTLGNCGSNQYLGWTRSRSALEK